MAKSWEKWLKVGKGGKKLEKVVQKWGEMGKVGEKWMKVAKSWKKWGKVGKKLEKVVKKSGKKLGKSGEKQRKTAKSSEKWEFVFTNWPAAAILDYRKSLLIVFLAILDQYAAFLFFDFFSKWPPAAILDDRKSLSLAFLAISDQYATLFFLFYFFKMVASGHFGFRCLPKSIGTSLYSMSVATSKVSGYIKKRALGMAQPQKRGS